MNCHYVPQFYLENFSIPNERGYIFAYKRDKKPFKTTAKSVAAKNDLYILTDKDGNKNDEVEKMLAHLEGQCKPIIDKIIDIKKLAVSNDEKILLSYFIAFLHIRNLSYLARQKNLYSAIMKKRLEVNARNKDTFKKILKESKVGVNVKNEREVDDLRDSILNFDKHFKIGFSKDSDDYFIGKALMQGLRLVPYVLGKEWCLLISDCNRVFITSDNPVVLVSPIDLPPFYGCGFANSHIYLPLSPKVAMILGVKRGQRNIAKIRRDDIDYFNSHIMFFAHKFVYSNILSQDFLKDFNQTKDDESEKVIMS